MQSSMASAERIFQLLDTQPAVRRSARATPRRARRERRARARLVEFEHVWFVVPRRRGLGAARRLVPGRAGRARRVRRRHRRRQDHDHQAAGRGSTTCDRGRIRIDGVDLREWPQRELRRRVAMVLQDVFLFSGTIEREHRARPRRRSIASAMRRAARAVQADRFIARLPQGYATEVRERGTNLSAGQRQLLSFARALAHGADVLVLDEATSAIDTETEALVQHGIHVLMEGKTALVIAHRLSTIQDVDRIYVLHKGQLVEAGTHDELLARGRGLRAPLPAPVRRAGRPGRGRGRLSPCLGVFADGTVAALRRSGGTNSGTPLGLSKFPDRASREPACCAARARRARGSRRGQVRLKSLELHGFKSFVDKTVISLQARHHRRRRAQRLRQVERRRRDALGDGRAGAAAPARQGHGGRDLRRLRGPAPPWGWPRSRSRFDNSDGTAPPAFAAYVGDPDLAPAVPRPASPSTCSTAPRAACATCRTSSATPGSAPRATRSWSRARSPRSCRRSPRSAAR